MNRLGPTTARNEVVTVHAQFQRALVTVEKRRPRVIRIGRMAPSAVLPDDLQVVEVEARGLRISGVGLGLFVDENAALRNDAAWPAEVEYPADRIEHVHAHVANDAVTILHEGPPCARVAKLIVRSQRRRATPHVVIEI